MYDRIGPEHRRHGKAVVRIHHPSTKPEIEETQSFHLQAEIQI